MTQPSITPETYTPDRLIAGDHPLITEEYTIASGENRKRGDLMGRVTADGKLKLSLSGAADGSETPHSILVNDVDASAADKQGAVYLSGEFNQDEVTFGASHSAASTREGLRDRSIYLKAPVKP